MILRSEFYHWAKETGNNWTEMLFHQNQMTVDFNRIYKRQNISIDYGYSIAGG